MNIEIERKFLIDLPDPTFICGLEGASVKDIVQTYLPEKISGNGEKVERRVRHITTDKRESFVYTEKRKCKSKAFSRFETEYEIEEEEYVLKRNDGETELRKTRYAFPYMGYVIEIDVYPEEIGGELLRGRAVLEVELNSEEDEILLPEFIHVISEITGNKAYSNKALAKKLKK